MVTGSTSTNTNCAPRSAKALAVLEKVNDGKITSSPAFMSTRRADNSSADVPDVVSSTRLAPVICCKASWHSLVTVPSPQILCESTTCLRYVILSGTYGGILKGITTILLSCVLHSAVYHTLIRLSCISQSFTICSKILWLFPKSVSSLHRCHLWSDSVPWFQSMHGVL